MVAILEDLHHFVYDRLARGLVYFCIFCGKACMSLNLARKGEFKPPGILGIFQIGGTSLPKLILTLFTIKIVIFTQFSRCKKVIKFPIFGCGVGVGVGYLGSA